MPDRRKQYHQCSFQGWAHCCVCEGRIHLPGCTATMRKQIDCCAARHKMLHDAGQIRGIGDESFIMWSEAEPMGYHEKSNHSH